MKIYRPKIKIQKDSLDHIIEIVAWCSLLAIIFFPYYFYDQLPDQVPSHFNIKGEPDAFGNKSVIWMLPVVGILTYLVLSIITRYPHTFNYPVPITESNAAKQYKLAVRLLGVMKAILTISLAYLSYCQIQNAIGDKHGLNTYFIPLFIMAMFFPIFIYYRNAKK